MRENRVGVPHMVDSSEWLNTREAMTYLGLGQYRFKKYVERPVGGIPYFYYCKRRYFNSIDLDAWREKYSQQLKRREKRYDLKEAGTSIIG